MCFRRNEKFARWTMKNVSFWKDDGGGCVKVDYFCLDIINFKRKFVLKNKFYCE